MSRYFVEKGCIVPYAVVKETDDYEYAEYICSCYKKKNAKTIAEILTCDSAGVIWEKRGRR